MPPSEPANRDKEVENLAEELARRWGGAFLGKEWPERLELLNEIHEQLLEDLGDLDLYSAVSPVFIRKIVTMLGTEPVTSAAQAHIYANSDDERHRQAAGEWLAGHGMGSAA